MTHTRHFILQPQPEGTWGVRGGECFSCAAQAAAGSRLLTMFCYLQAAVADFSFQHLALLLFAGCLVPKGKLWWLVLGGAAGHKTPASRSIPVPPFPPTHMGLSALWTGCGTAGRCLQPSASAWSRCLLSLLCFQLSLLPLNMRAFSLLSTSGTVSHPLSLAGCGAAGTVCSGCKGQPLLGWGRSALLILHHHQQAAPWKGQLCNGCIYKDTRHLLSVLVRCHKPPPKNK